MPALYIFRENVLFVYKNEEILRFYVLRGCVKQDKFGRM